MGLTNQFLNLLVPGRCLICGKYIVELNNVYPLCPDCEIKLVLINKDICANCGYPLISELNLCKRCKGIDFNYISNRSIFNYSGDIKELLYQYKFKSRKQLSDFFAKYLAAYLIRDYPDSIIVPVPGRKIVKKRQGWEHIDLISTILNKKYKLPVQKILIRKGKKAQKFLSRELRAENLQKNVRIKRNIKLLPQSIVLLDDVFTTGTTINECAGILKSAGVKQVYSLTIAID